MARAYPVVNDDSNNCFKPVLSTSLQTRLTHACVFRLAIFVTWGYLNSFGSFQTYYEQTMPEKSPSVISWIGSLQIWLTMIGGVFTGRLLDAGFFVPTFLVGAVIQVLGLFLMSICTEYWQFMLTQGLLTGVGGGLFFTPALALVATVRNTNRRTLWLSARSRLMVRAVFRQETWACLGRLDHGQLGRWGGLSRCRETAATQGKVSLEARSSTRPRADC